MGKSKTKKQSSKKRILELYKCMHIREIYVCVCVCVCVCGKAGKAFTCDA